MGAARNSWERTALGDTSGWGKILTFAVLAGALLAPAVAARAYTPEALADFSAARQFQAAKQWSNAVRAYQAALKADPSLTVAYKALGTIYYQAGDRKGSLYFYDRYLGYYPNDAPTKEFADRLRASLGAGAAAPAIQAAGGHSAGPFNPGFDLRFDAGGVFASGADVDEFYDWYTPSEDPGSSVTQPGGALAYGVGLGIDYGFSGGFIVGLDAQYGPNRTQNASLSSPDFFGGNDTENATYNISQYAILLSPGWRFKLGQAFVLEPCLGLGIMPATFKGTANFTVSSQAAAMGEEPPPTTTDAASGTGYAVWPQIKGEYLFGQFGLGLSLGYLINTATTMKITAYSPLQPGQASPVGTDLQYYPSPTATSPSNWALNSSGFSVSLYASYYFTPLF